MSPCCHSLCGSVDWNLSDFRTAHAFHVTPFAGVWIETDLTADEFTRLMSLPLRECGLKPEIYGTIERKSGHSLCGSVDWNVSIIISFKISLRSLPLRECGLKSELDAYRLSAYASLPLWECGLKLSSWITMQSPDLVTPLVRVWIEIAWNDSDCIRCEKSLPL